MASQNRPQNRVREIFNLLQSLWSRILLIILVSATISYGLHSTFKDDRRIIKAEIFLGVDHLSEADTFIKSLFPVGANAILFRLVLEQSGLTGGHTDRKAAARSEYVFRDTRASGYFHYRFIGACPSSTWMLRPACEVRFFAEHDSNNVILSVYAGSDRHDL